MAVNLAYKRQEAHLLLDELPDEKFAVVSDLLEVLNGRHTDALTRALANAPWDDEELKPETAAALNRASASLDRGESVSHEAMLEEFGL